MPEELANPKKEKKMKKIVKEGGKRGVEIEGAADMGWLQFFCTAVDEPEGNVDMLYECLKAMNAKSDPTEEERRLYHDLRGHQRRRHHRLRSML